MGGVSMTVRRAPVGTRVKAWAERHCDGETLDRLILPAIADLQYEDDVSMGRPGIVRWAIRLRGYVGLGEAVAAHLVSRHAAAAKTPEAPVSISATSGGARSGIMSESNRNLLLTVGAGMLVAGVAFGAGRLSAPAPAASPMWETPPARSTAVSDDYRTLQRSIDEQRREAAERDRRFQQQLDQQRYDADMERARAERARIDAETELASQRTEQMWDQRRRDAEVERAKEEKARLDAETALARQRMQLALDELSRKR
jgi:hypothetical protein